MSKIRISVNLVFSMKLECFFIQNALAFCLVCPVFRHLILGCPKSRLVRISDICFTYCNIIIPDYIGCIEYLLEKGANVEAKDMAGHTPLFFCTGLMGNDLALKIAKLLVKAGANVNAVNRMGATPLFESTMIRNLKSVNFLLVNKFTLSKDLK